MEPRCPACDGPRQFNVLIGETKADDVVCHHPFHVAHPSCEDLLVQWRRRLDDLCTAEKLLTRPQARTYARGEITVLRWAIEQLHEVVRRTAAR